MQNTIDLITAAQDNAADDIAAHAPIARIADANQKMARYRAAIDAGGDPEEIGAWIGQAKTQRVRAETDLRNAAAATRLTRHQIDGLITSIEDAAAMLSDAEPAQIADAYDKLGLRLTYDPAGQTVHATALMMSVVPVAKLSPDWLLMTRCTRSHRHREVTSANRP